MQGSQVLDSFALNGFYYDLNFLIPRNSNIELKPFLNWEKKLIRLPYFWEDDTHLIYNDSSDVEFYLKTNGLKIFDFHPIHIFLNTENLDRYERSKKYLNNNEKLLNFRNTASFGTHTFFSELIQSNTL